MSHDVDGYYVSLGIITINFMTNGTMKTVHS